MDETQELSAILTIRPYRASDESDVARVCVQTGAAGEDATGMYSDDMVIPDVAAIPYLKYQPELALVVENGDRVIGYVVGVSDTASFVDWWQSSWSTEFASRHMQPSDPESPRGAIPEAQLHHLAVHPEYLLIPEVLEYPAHLHINLLPGAQGQGLGRELVRRFLGGLGRLGAPALHLGVDSHNSGALAFYERLGFHRLPSATQDFVLLGISTAG